ncbi:MAG: hypothetical protein ACR652_02630 [Methylocystis sp.]|uniref:hypothetical protein n=1 Tax=Methylocystis sp. TaxID=1911079 RepID=UPI003DA35E1F
MSAALKAPPTPDDPPPLWANIIAAIPPTLRQMMLDQIVALSREAAAAHVEVERLREPSRAEWVRQRDDAIREALASCFPGETPSGAAKALAAELRKYAAGGWTRERDLETMPNGSSDLRLQMHRIMQLSDGKVLAWRRLLQIAA